MRPYYPKSIYHQMPEEVEKFVARMGRPVALDEIIKYLGERTVWPPTKQQVAWLVHRRSKKLDTFSYHQVTYVCLAGIVGGFLRGE